MGVKLLNDKFGIQTRGGCSCAGTYGHFLLNVSPEYSNTITSEINEGNCSNKPGWIRMSIHPTHTNEEIEYVMDAIKQLAENYQEWIKGYDINLAIGSIKPKNMAVVLEKEKQIDDCFSESFA